MSYICACLQSQSLKEFGALQVLGIAYTSNGPWVIDHERDRNFNSLSAALNLSSPNTMSHSTPPPANDGEISQHGLHHIIQHNSNTSYPQEQHYDEGLHLQSHYGSPAPQDDGYRYNQQPRYTYQDSGMGNQYVRPWRALARGRRLTHHVGQLQWPNVSRPLQHPSDFASNAFNELTGYANEKWHGAGQATTELATNA